MLGAMCPVLTYCAETMQWLTADFDNPFISGFVWNFVKVLSPVSKFRDRIYIETGCKQYNCRQLKIAPKAEHNRLNSYAD